MQAPETERSWQEGTCLTAGSFLLQKVLKFPVLSWAFPARANCVPPEGKQCGEGLFKGMMLPAVVSERFSAVLLKSDRGVGRRKGKMTTASHPCIVFLQHCFHLFHFLLEKMERCPEYILPLALVICRLLKNSWTQRQSVGKL